MVDLASFKMPLAECTELDLKIILLCEGEFYIAAVTDALAENLSFTVIFLVKWTFYIDIIPANSHDGHLQTNIRLTFMSRSCNIVLRQTRPAVGESSLIGWFLHFA